MTGVRRLFIPGYYSGYSNNRMSLDIAVMLAFLTDRVLVPYRFRLPRRFGQDAQPEQVLEPMLVPQLFDIPVPWSDAYLLKTWVSVPDAVACTWSPVHESVFCMPGDVPLDDERFAQFRNGRQYINTFSQREHEALDLYIDTQTLGFFSYFAYLNDAQRRAVVDLMRRVRPKQRYLDAANRIAAHIGTFNAIHLRRDDFLRNELARDKVTRAASVSGQEIVATLAARMHRDDPLIICTDGSSREEVFGPIQKHFRETIFLDRYLRDHPALRTIMAGLPQHHEGVDALVTQLVASKARVFAGTLFSTFTALIHRYRAFERQESDFLYCYNDFVSPLVRYEQGAFLPVDDGPYTWNRIRYPVSPDAYAWLREWPEAVDAAPPPFNSDPLPTGTIVLQAHQATMQGSFAQQPGASDQILIGEWADQNAFVRWNLTLSTDATYAVEIRYGCSREVVGSRYRVGIEGGDALYGQVWDTGTWSSLSPWLPLGRITIPAGSSGLIVRAVETTTYAVMNLGAVRLIPIKIIV